MEMLGAPQAEAWPRLNGVQAVVNQLQEMMCLDTKEGKELWATSLGGGYTNEYGDGPRGTPTVSEGRVVALGANGELLCADATTGKELWHTSLVDLGGKVPPWGYTESPLVDGGKVVVTPGGEKGAVVALDFKTGTVLWQSRDFIDEAQYTSLVPLDISGKGQYVCANREHLTGLAADDGRIAWQEKFRSGVVVAQSPVVSGDMVYATAAGGTGSKLFKLTAPDTADLVYANKIMKNLPGGLVLHEGHIFGYSDARGWMCQDFLTGEPLWEWENPAFKKGTITVAGGKLICVEEDSGTVVLAEASAKEWKEISRFTLAPESQQRAKQGKVWTVPVVAHGRLYLRDQEQLFCYDYK